VLNERYEGLVIRIPSGRYKCGRSTIAEGLMIKMKPHDDCEAEIVGTEELMRNTNVMQRDNFGRAKRSSSNSGLISGDTLGAIVAITPDGDVFKVGTGFTSEQRRELWGLRDSLVGCLVKYKCDTAHTRMVPRSPVFIGIRHKDDVK
jgi:DNA ligase 1